MQKLKSIYLKTVGYVDSKFKRVVNVNVNNYLLQTVSCKDCKFKGEDCLHMQWILKVWNWQINRKSIRTDEKEKNLLKK